MIVRYFLVILIVTLASNASHKKSQDYMADPKITCNITSLHDKKAKLEKRKEYLEDRIEELWDKTNNQESIGDEQAKLRSFLKEVRIIDKKLIRVERLLQKQLCRFL